MSKHIQILNVEKDGEDGLTVTFSDGTIGGYVVEELLLLRPIRETIEKPEGRNLREMSATHKQDTIPGSA
jgi:hypothetical protein